MISSPGVSDSNQGEENFFYKNLNLNFDLHEYFYVEISRLTIVLIFPRCLAAETENIVQVSALCFVLVSFVTKNLPRISLLKGKIKQQAEAELGQAQKSGTERC